MRLADFITSNLEPILVEWEAFARTCGPGADDMDAADLRDHAANMLRVIAKDLKTPETALAQSEKSKGNAPAVLGASDTPAETHGALRFTGGFTLDQTLAEFRALRASVLRLWAKQHAAGGRDEIEDLTRFNEAVDQALAESTERFSQEVESAEKLFVGILGHDLRTPLGAIKTTAEYLLQRKETEEIGGIIWRSSRRMEHLIRDMIGFAQSHFGAGIPVDRVPTELGSAIRDTIAEFKAARPNAQIEFTYSGDLSGNFCRNRMEQVISNLIGNALDYGDHAHPVIIEATGEPDDVVLKVKNRGPLIPAHSMKTIFDPMRRLRSAKSTEDNVHGIGLGLYIARLIVAGHSGTISVESTEERGTIFTVSLPRN